MAPESGWTWSPEFRRLVGFAPDDTEGFPDKVESWSERLHPDDVQSTFDAFGACLDDVTGKTGYDVEYRLRTKDGSYRWFRAVGGVARHPDGSPARACGALIDVHEQTMHAERSSVLDSHAGVGLWDAQLHEGDAMHPESIWTWSPEFRRLVGFAPDDTVGFPDKVQSWSDRLHPDDVQPTFDAFGACLNDGTGKTGYDVTYRLRAKNGSYRWFRAVGGVTRYPDGSPARACGALIDVHEQTLNAERSNVLDSHAGVGLWDAQLHQGDAMHPQSIWTWSPEYRRLVGFAPDDTEGFPNKVQSWVDRLHPDDVEPTFDAFGACLNDSTGKVGYDVAYRLRTKDGSYRWFRAVGGVTRHPDGSPARACGALIDVHEQTLNAERSSVLDSHAGVGLWDAQLHQGDAMHPQSVWTWSPEFRRLVGFAPGDTVGFPNTVHSWADRIHPEDVELTFDAFGECLNDTTGNLGYDVEYRLRTKDGSYRWFRAVGGVSRDPSGTPARACGALIDVHEQTKAAERADLLDHHAGVGLWDAELHDGDPSHPQSVWTWSPEFRRLLGFDPEDTQGFPNLMESWSDRLHPDDSPGTFEAFNACLNDRTGKISFNHTYRLRLADGSYRWFRAVGDVSRHSDGSPARACGSLIDAHDELMAVERRAALRVERGELMVTLANTLESEVCGSADTAVESAESVALASKELAVAISEISSRVHQAASSSSAVADEAHKIDTAMRHLETATDRIGKVLDLISAVASQTRLLALNATIEAVRVGEQGRGFAIVASEVKDLASQTTTAVDEITSQVESVQTEVAGLARAINRIDSLARDSQSYTTEISSSIVEQDASTQEIATRVTEVVGAVKVVTDRTSSISAQIRDSGEKDMNANAA